MSRYNTPLSIGLFLLLAYLSSCGSAPTGADSQQEKPKKNLYVKGEMPVQHGMELFNLHCASCHNFSENGIGPNLTGVTSAVEKEWLVKFIHNPPEVIASGDPRAVQLFEKYQAYMPPFPMLEGEDLEDILGFIHKFSEGEKRNKNNRPGGLINPVLEKIATADLTLELEEYLRVPPSSDVTPLTRINKMTPIPGGRLFLHDLRGKLFEINPDRSLSEYLDVTAFLPEFIDNPGKASGLGSWAFHPDFEENGLFYTTHTEPKGAAPADFRIPDSMRITLQSVLLEWKATEPGAPAFEGTHRELLRVDMISAGHTFQELVFNPLATPNTAEYGMLYLGIGDGGAALRGYSSFCDNNKQIWSSVLRIDPTGDNSANGKYGIPPDNPFVNTPGALGEVWANGFRNPHRISWDETGSGKMIITNIGQHSLEELNLGKAGANYGWPYREGTFLFDADANPELVYPLPEEGDAFTYPVAQYDHDEGSAVSGGFVYAGKEVPLLTGKYVFGDISRGTVFYTEVAEMIDGQQAPVYKLKVSINGEVSDMETISENKRVDLRIGQDAGGELYLLTKGNGAVYKIVDCRKDAQYSQLQ